MGKFAGRYYIAEAEVRPQLALFFPKKLKDRNSSKKDSSR